MQSKPLLILFILYAIDEASDYCSGYDFEEEKFSSDYLPSDEDDDCDYQTNDEQRSRNLAKLQNTRRLVIEKKKLYLGVSTAAEFIIDYLVERLQTHFDKRSSNLIECKDVVFIVLQKLKTNDQFDRLSDQYGLSNARLSAIFRKYLPLIARELEPLIYWPKSADIRNNTAPSFRANYSDVTIIIDAFEIEIEKPSDPYKQSLTFSSYKGTNTMKFLVGVTPDCVGSFVSKGIGGRASDKMLVNWSGFAEKLRPNMKIMADRGFKHIVDLLQSCQCELVRPPSVSQGQILSKDQANLAKDVASLRVHVERFIRRIREFRFLSPHACTDIKMVDLLNPGVIVAVALINLSEPLIKSSDILSDVK